jgi:hypothetical protein
MTDSIGNVHEPESPLLLAQLEQLRLTNEKLKLEIDQLKKPGRSQPTLLQFLPVVTALVAVSGFLWGVAQYVREQKAIQSRAEREFMKPWLESQHEIYLQALSFAATVTNSDKPTDKKQATYEFWRLYQGKMILIETKAVSDAMGKFGECLQYDGACTQTEMIRRVQSLASEMAESMAATAKMNYEDYSANQFKYVTEK